MKVYLVYCQRMNNGEADLNTTHVAAVFRKRELAQKYADHWNEKQTNEWIHWVIETPLDFYADVAKNY